MKQLKEKSSILFIMHMPPPVHGAAMMGECIHNSKIINTKFECYYINPSVSNRIAEVGKLNIKKILLFFLLLYKIFKSIKKIKPDLCYYTPTSDGFGIYRDALTIALIQKCNVKVVLHLHNKGVKNYSKHKFAQFAYKRIFHNTKVILIAQELYKDIEQFTSKDNIYILPNGIPLTIKDSEYNKIITERKVYSEKNRLLYLSNMMSEKGIWILLDACKDLHQRGYKFECHYIGNWGDTTLDEFQNEIDSRGLHNIVFCHGPKYGNDKKQYFTNSDIFIFPTFYHGETFGLVLLEAMEYGLPCITTPEGGIPSFVTSENGILVEQKNVQQLADAIETLINDKDKREYMGSNGRQVFIKEYTIDKFENHLVDILNKILSI